MDDTPANSSANENPPDNAASASAGQPGKHRRKPPSTERKKVRYGLYLPETAIPGVSYLDKQVHRYRRQLEDAVIRRHKEVNETNAGIVQTAVAFTWAASFHLLELGKCYAELKPTERAKLAYEASRALQQRDACVRSLNLQDFDTDTVPTFDSEE